MLGGVAESRGGDIKTKTSFFLFVKIEWRDSPLTVAWDTKKKKALNTVSTLAKYLLTTPPLRRANLTQILRHFFNIAESDTGTDEEMKYKD